MSDLTTMNVAELTDHFNAIPGVTKVKKFKSKEEAIAAIKAAGNGKAKAAAPAKAPKEPKAPKEKAAPAPLDLPFKGQADGTLLHKIRGNTINADMVTAMSRKEGASIEELSAIVAKYDAARENESKDTVGRARSLMRMLHSYNGYGIRQKGERYYLVTKAS